MTRITENHNVLSSINYMNNNRNLVDKYSQEVATGLKVSDPGDSTYSSTIAQLNDLLNESKGFRQQIAGVKGVLEIQEQVLASAGNELMRAKEIAEQAANETNSAAERAILAEEVFQIRDELVHLANTQYQGSYIFAGTADNQPAYSAATYTNGVGGGLERYVYTSNAGANNNRTVNVTDTLTVDVTLVGSNVFNRAIQGLERLGRALQGYETLPASGTPPTVGPDGTGNAFSGGTAYDLQTQAILDSMQVLDAGRQSDILTTRTTVAGRLRRLETADAILDIREVSTKEVLKTLQDADQAESASLLTQAQTALQASYIVSNRLLNLSVLDYL